MWNHINNIGERLWYITQLADSELSTTMIEESESLRQRKILLGKNSNTSFSAITFNIDCTVKFHKDQNDNPKTMACTAVLWEENVRPCPYNYEGIVVLPEYNIGIQLGHGDCYLLRARETIHGVTSSNMKRVSIVAFQHQYL